MSIIEIPGTHILFLLTYYPTPKASPAINFCILFMRRNLDCLRDGYHPNATEFGPAALLTCGLCRAEHPTRLQLLQKRLQCRGHPGEIMQYQFTPVQV